MASTPHRQEVHVKPQIAVLYSDASAAALIDALKVWRKDYAENASYEVMMSTYVASCTVETRMPGNGKALIVVKIEGRRGRQSDEYYFEATLQAGEITLHKTTD